MSIEGPQDLEGLKRAGAAVAAARDAMAKYVAAGISTAELDALGAEVLRRHGARSAPQRAYGFPGATCISVNDALAHGIPSRATVLKEGDVVNLDVSAELDGYWADTGASFAVGTPHPTTRNLLSATRAALEDALRQARAGAPINEIGRAVERRARLHRLRVINNLTGHGVGRSIHEPPNVPNTYHPRDRRRLHEGLVIAIEPILSVGADHVVEDDDGWTLRTPDGSIGAQFEHTVVITRGEPILLTASAA